MHPLHMFAKEQNLPTHNINLVQHNRRLSQSYVPFPPLLSLQPVTLHSTPRYWCECQVVKYPFGTSFHGSDL